MILINTPHPAEDYVNQAVCQQYISPFLLGGLKFDLRIYVLLTQINPFRAYIHNENMVRFCTEPYQKPNKKNFNDSFSHLTNYAINKNNENFIENDNNDTNAHKRSTYSVFAEMEKLGVDISDIQLQIDNIIILTLLSIHTQYAHNYRSSVKFSNGRSRLFEILGFDILIDKNKKCWLLEVNNMPCMSLGSAFDTSLKTSVIEGTFKILNLQKNFKKVIMNQQKNLSQNRILRESKALIGKMYDSEEESKRAKETNWRQLLPLKESDPKFEMVNEIYKIVCDPPPPPVKEIVPPSNRKEIQEKVIPKNEGNQHQTDGKIKKCDLP